MSYVQGQLLPGERVKHRAHLHRIIYLGPGIFAALMMLVAILVMANGSPIALSLPIALILIGVGVLPLLLAHITYKTSEFAVTDKRVIIKVGWIRRRTLETMLGKVEGIGVDQGIVGRMLDFGTITVTGTGGTREPFPNIAQPLEFRRQVQAQVSATDDLRVTRDPAGMQVLAEPSAPREDRDCPFCAERILVLARVCKHCGRDVQPAPAA